MRNILISAFCSPLLLGSAYAATSPAGAEISILAPQDGAVLSGPVTVRFGVKGMDIAPAGEVKDNSGHFHLLIDADELPAAGQPIAKDEHHLHFGKGQMQTTLTLTPGEHSLQLVLGDGAHVPHTPPVISKRINITVK
ncbi:MAG: DUF4399 domain-containing protein [Gammaproteobacteria bacterium]